MGGGGGGGGRVGMMNNKGCSRLFNNISSSFPSFRRLQSPVQMSPASSSSSVLFRSVDPPSAPFFGLVICVTGLSKEARTQVRDATERMGGHYSSDLHPQCTHLVVQSFHGRKFEHALKHGSRNSLFVVTLGWFMDSVKRNVRLNESLYSVNSVRESGVHRDDLNQLVHDAATESSCLSVGLPEHAKHADVTIEQRLQLSERSKRSVGLTFSGQSMYFDPDVSTELQSKVVEAAAEDGAVFVDQWFVGCNASHVVCEGPSIRKYLGHSNNLVTPLWVLKTAKEKHLQRLVHVSADLARQLGSMLDGVQSGLSWEEINGDGDLQDAPCFKSKSNHEERQKIVNLAKIDVRKRRCRHLQTSQTVIRPITPSVLLDSICWSISEPTSTAAIYTDSLSVEDASKKHKSVRFDHPQEDGKELESSFVNLSRPLRESEKTELIFKNHFITILFPVDRFSEMGPSSRTFFSDAGFTCLQVLDHIYAFYQENMPGNEIEVAIHTDSRHADRLRSLYSSKETAERGYISFKRIDFLGSRRSFEMLKRVTGDNSSNVYELVVRA